MKALLCTLVCMFSVTCFAQTKLIAHRSHSGSDANFRKAVEDDMFDTNRSNFGLSVDHVVSLDSVILKGNKIIVMRKSYNIINGFKANPRNVAYIKDELTKANAAEVFAANSADSLKVKLHKLYTSAKLDSTVFIGFDKKFKAQKQ